MKYGKYLAKRQLDIPEYSNYFMNYKGLKKVIKSLSAPAGTLQEIQKTLQDNKATFFFRIERELEKVNSFYLQKEAELKLRLEILCEKKNTAYSAGSLFSKTSLSFIALHEGFQRFLRDLDKLEQFVNLNATAFSKVLKKWDKRSKSQTKEQYLTRAVDVQPVFHREELAEMSDLASSSILELEAWSDGESVIFEGKSSSANTDTDLVKECISENIIPDSQLASGQSNQLQSLQQQYHKHALINPNTNVSVSSPSDSRATDELYHEFIKAASSIDTENTPQVLADWISRLSQLEGARKQMTRIFLLAITTKASDAALIALYNSGYIDICAHDEITNQTVLHKACISGRITIVDLALKGNVKPSIQDTYGRTAIHYACIGNHFDLIPKLVESDKSVLDSLDKDNFSPLLCSIITKHSECVRMLIKLGAKVDASDTEKFYIPLNFACQYGVYDAAEMLLGCSSSNQPNMRPDAEGLYPIHIAARAGHSKLIKLLTSYNANVDEIDKLNKWTALFYAVSEGHSQTVYELINAHATIDILDDDGYSPLYYAAWEGHVRCMEHLSKALVKANLSKNTKKTTSLPNDTVNASDSISSPLDHSRAIHLNSGNFDNIVGTSTAPNDSLISLAMLSPKNDSLMDIESADIDGIPDLSLPPPILPLRKYGHNFLDKKIFVQLIFDAAPYSSSSSLHPNVGSAFADQNLKPFSVFSSSESICSAESSDEYVDPPSVPGKKPIEFDKGDNFLPAGRLTITSRGNHDIIPQNVILPFSDTDRVVSFQVDSLDNFAVDFEVYPTYGTRIVAKTSALTYVFTNPSGYGISKNNNGDKYPETLGTKHYCTLPLFDMRLRTVGKLNFAFQIVKPFFGEPLEITKFDTYWKSTSQVEQPLLPNISQNSTPVVTAKYINSTTINKLNGSTESQVQLLLQSQRSDSSGIGSILNNISSSAPTTIGNQNNSVSTINEDGDISTTAVPSGSLSFGPPTVFPPHQISNAITSHHLSTSHHGGFHPSTPSLFSQSLSFITASSLSGTFARIKVCLTKDKIPIVVPFWTISIADDIKVPIGNLNFVQVLSLAASRLSITVDEYKADCKQLINSLDTPEAVHSIVSTRYFSLEEFLSASPVDLKLDICVLYPTLIESRYTNLGLSSFTNLNEYVDDILNILFDHIRSVRSLKKNKKPSIGLDGKLYDHNSDAIPTRSVIFSSAHPDVCTVLNWKQPNYPVFFQVSGVDIDTSKLKRIARAELENQILENNEEYRRSSDSKREKQPCFRLVSAHGFPVTETDRRCTSLKDAVSFVSNNNLLGIICNASLLSLVPSLAATIRVFGLVLVSETSIHSASSISNNQLKHNQYVQGVDGVRSEKVLDFKCAINM